MAACWAASSLAAACHSDQCSSAICSAASRVADGLLGPAELLVVSPRALGQTAELPAQLARSCPAPGGPRPRCPPAPPSSAGRPRWAQVAWWVLSSATQVRRSWLGAIGSSCRPGRRCGRPGRAASAATRRAACRSAVRGAARTSASDPAGAGVSSARCAAARAGGCSAELVSSASIWAIRSWRWAARAAAPMCRARSATCRPRSGPLRQLPVGRHCRGAPRVVEADAGQDCGDRRPRAARRPGPGAARSTAAGRGRRLAGLSSSSPSAASTAPSGWMTALSRPAASSAPSRPA